MRNFLLTLVSLAATTAVNAQSLYSTDFATESEFENGQSSMPTTMV